MKHNRLLEEFVMLTCAPDLLAWKVFPNVKEITEAMGMFSALISFAGQNMSICSDPNIVAVVFGDGTTPRLGALIATRTAWTVYSVDPNLRTKQWPIKRLELLRCKGEDLSSITACQDRDVIAFFPHSHAPMKQCLEKIEKPRSLTVVAMPCCLPIPESISAKPHWSVCNPNINSPKNRICIWELKKWENQKPTSSTCAGLDDWC